MPSYHNKNLLAQLLKDKEAGIKIVDKLIMPSDHVIKYVGKHDLIGDVYLGQDNVSPEIQNANEKDLAEVVTHNVVSSNQMGGGLNKELNVKNIGKKV